MKKYIVSALFFALLSLVLYAQEAFVIDSYVVDIDVQENNVYHITENIFVTFSEERRGIFRDLPLRFDEYHIRVRDVAVDGRDFKLISSKDSLRIRIGHPEIFVDGRQQYTISYLYDIGADSLADMDEFNHNIVGLGWNTDILSVTFNVRMPKEFNPDNVNCTSGPYGSTDSSGVQWQVEGNTIRGKTTRALSANEGLTIALPLNEGYWVGARRHWPPIHSLLAGYPLYALVIILSFILWFHKGKDNRVIKVVEFAPPDGMTPSEIGYIVDGSVDSEDITALIIYWAQKGCLEIKEVATGRGSGKELQLKKLKDLPKTARSYEKKLFKDLFSFASENTVKMSDLEYKFHTSLYEAQGSVQSWFQNSEERSIFDKSAENTKVGCLTVSTGFISGILAFIPVFVFTLGLVSEYEPPFMFKFLAFFVSMFLVVLYSMVVQQISLGAVASRIKLIVGAYFSLALTAGIGYVSLWVARVSILDFVLPVATSIICSCFVSAMSRRTPYGDRILGRVLGFRDFLVKAEKDKLDRMFEADPQYFFTILPYAIVLRVSDKWASHFDGLALQPPSWYRGYGYERFNARDFNRTLGASMATMSSAMKSAPASSSGSSGSSGSSSSGGFSGGGSGGGGGGSW